MGSTEIYIPSHLQNAFILRMLCVFASERVRKCTLFLQSSAFICLCSGDLKYITLIEKSLYFF